MGRSYIFEIHKLLAKRDQIAAVAPKQTPKILPMSKLNQQMLKLLQLCQLRLRKLLILQLARSDT